MLLVIRLGECPELGPMVMLMIGEGARGQGRLPEAGEARPRIWREMESELGKQGREEQHRQRSCGGREPGPRGSRSSAASRLLALAPERPAWITAGGSGSCDLRRSLSQARAGL